MMTKKNVTPVIVLAAICIAAALLLSVINLFTAPKIAENKNKAAFESLAEVLPDGKNFKQLTLDDKYPSNITEVYTADGGFVFRSTGMGGKNGNIEIMVGISADGKIVATKVLDTKETPGYADPVYAKVEGTNGAYSGQTLESFAPVLVAGSTVTSKAYANAVEAALKAYVVANGGTVDTRTPEEILQDNCNAALGTENLVFTEWFATESITGIDVVYESEEGRVYVIGESFIGVKNATVVTEGASAENTVAAIIADDIISKSTLTKITDLPEGLSSMFVEAYVTASGNYVITTKGDGFGINGDSHYYPSNEYITVKIVISADGKIIDTVTVYHKETANIGGAVLTDPEFINQFNGKTELDYTTVNNASGATLTSLGYKAAIKTAFKTFELLTGGNE